MSMLACRLQHVKVKSSQVAASQVEPSFPLSLALSLSSSMWAAAAASAATTH